MSPDMETPHPLCARLGAMLLCIALLACGGVLGMPEKAHAGSVVDYTLVTANGTVIGGGAEIDVNDLLSGIQWDTYFPRDYLSGGALGCTMILEDAETGEQTGFALASGMAAFVDLSDCPEYIANGGTSVPSYWITSDHATLSHTLKLNDACMQSLAAYFQAGHRYTLSMQWYQWTNSGNHVGSSLGTDVYTFSAGSGHGDAPEDDNGIDEGGPDALPGTGGGDAVSSGSTGSGGSSIGAGSASGGASSSLTGDDVSGNEAFAGTGEMGGIAPVAFDPAALGGAKSASDVLAELNDSLDRKEGGSASSQDAEVQQAKGVSGTELSRMGQVYGLASARSGDDAADEETDAADQMADITGIPLMWLAVVIIFIAAGPLGALKRAASVFYGLRRPSRLIEQAS